MRWTVGALALLSLIGGFLQFAPLWHPLSTWLGPVAKPFAEPTNAQEWAISGAAVAVGLAGIVVAWLIYSAKTVPVPRPVRLFEKKFYWDELYDYLWYYPADLVARGFYALVERPLIAGTIDAVGGTVGFGACRTGTLPEARSNRRTDPARRCTIQPWSPRLRTANDAASPEAYNPRCTATARTSRRLMTSALPSLQSPQFRRCNRSAVRFAAFGAVVE